ncbi:MAG: phage holin family protein [bacterium]|jgi:hypothetical protein
MATMYEPEFPSGPGAGRAPLPERPVAEVLKDIVGNIREIIRSEIVLAREEMRDKARTAGKASVMVAAGAVLLLFGFGFLLAAIYAALDIVMPAWAAALIVFGLMLIIGGALASIGLNRLKRIDPAPRRALFTARETVDTVSLNAKDTAQTVKEGVQWTRDRVR